MRLSLRLLLTAGLILSSLTATAQDQRWRNAGGMWMPQQMVDHAETLKHLGIEIDPALLSDPSSNVMQAIISLAYCSGSFISPDGLIITNHHCVDGMLSYLSKEDMSNGKRSDFVKTGFQSYARTEERNTGPTERVFVTQKVSDVTARVMGGVDQIADPAERDKEIEKRIKAIIAETEHGRPHIRAELKGFFQGERYFLIEKLEVKDVRLVYAPPRSVGFFGGDDDNWRWPRQTGDFSILRAYVGPDGMPREYHPDNVPYKPANYLKVSARGMQPQDLVMVAGYPGRTERLNTADQLGFQVDKSLPFVVSLYKAIVKTIDRMGLANEEARIKTESFRFSLMNSLQKQEGALASLTKMNLVSQKERFEAELQTWLQADPALVQKYGNPLAELAAIRAGARKGFEGDTLLSMVMRLSTPLAGASTVVRMAEERPKADADRDMGFQERMWQPIRQGESSKQKSYMREVDLTLLSMILERAAALPEQPEWLPLFVDAAKLSQGVSIRQQLEALYGATTMEDLNTRLALFDTATTQQLEQSADPMVRIALELRKKAKAGEDKARALSGEIALIIPRYIGALREFTGRPIAPDANSTLRVTFGQVKGYTDPETGKYFHPFSNTSQLAEKTKRMLGNSDQYYGTPQEVMDAIARRDFDVYGDPVFGEVPVNFLADVDTTGGNSGSAALNKRGELVGLLFDGTIHSLGGDWLFTANQRSILLDIRYALWMLDRVYGMKHILAEMQIDAPTCEEMLSGRDDINHENTSGNHKP